MRVGLYERGGCRKRVMASEEVRGICRRMLGRRERGKLRLARSADGTNSTDDSYATFKRKWTRVTKVAVERSSEAVQITTSRPESGDLGLLGGGRDAQPFLASCDRFLLRLRTGDIERLCSLPDKLPSFH
jgi:hypothetical protein